MLIYLAKIGLPWMKLEIKKNLKEKAFEALKLKKSIKIEKVCEGLPEEFIDYIKYCRNLDFEQDPNYDYLRNLFTLILIKENQKNDLNLFWINKKKAESITKNYENNSIKKREIHKRLYNSVKKSLEKKRKEGIYNTLESDYSKPNNSLNKTNDNQNNKKEIQKINFISRNLNIKDLNDKTKISIKNDNTYNNINEKTITTPRIDGQKYNSILKKLKLNKFISNKSLCYNLKNKFQIMKIKLTKNISGKAGLKNTFSIPNKNISNSKNITSKNDCNLKDDINNNNYQSQIKKTNNYYSNEIENQTPSNNYYYRIIPEIHYRSKFKNKRILDNKNRFENHSIYSFQNNVKHSRNPNDKNRFENQSIYSFQNNVKNSRNPNDKNRFENHSIYSL